MPVKEWLGAVGRSIRDKLRNNSGLDVRTVRGREHWRAGLELIWRPFDHRTERTIISHVDSFGTPVLFLVRDQRDYIQSHFLSGHFYAEPELQLIQQYYSRGTFLDIGSNVGNHALFAAKILNAPKVIAVEPNPEAYRILKCNVALNDVEHIIDHRRIAFSDHEGSASIEAREGNLGLAVVDEKGSGVHLAIGDDQLTGENVGFIKIDVEGHELQVLHGLRQTITRNRPPMLIEVDDVHEREFEEILREIQYRSVETFSPYHNQRYVLAVPEQSS